MTHQDKQPSGRFMYPNEINLIRNGFESLGNMSKQRANDLHGSTHYCFTEIVKSDNLLIVYAKPKYKYERKR